MKNFHPVLRLALPALLLAVTLFLFASDSGSYALFLAAPDEVASAISEKTNNFTPPREP